ncbi:hypothetical protein [Sodalis-like endosymbiont of Proechinophthirus fluctus]|nr:hypothetical protein [Sodalis-like endosymbiont of Proechinophthirus fluctus]
MLSRIHALLRRISASSRERKNPSATESIVSSSVNGILGKS